MYQNRKTCFHNRCERNDGIRTLKQLLARPNRFKVRALLRPSDKNRVFAKKHMCPALEVVWGDMSDYDTIKNA